MSERKIREGDPEEMAETGAATTPPADPVRHPMPRRIVRIDAPSGPQWLVQVWVVDMWIIEYSMLSLESAMERATEKGRRRAQVVWVGAHVWPKGDGKQAGG